MLRSVLKIKIKDKININKIRAKTKFQWLPNQKTEAKIRRSYGQGGKKQVASAVDTMDTERGKEKERKATNEMD